MKGESGSLLVKSFRHAFALRGFSSQVDGISE